MRLLALIALLLPFAALGQGSTALSCTPPTTNTDGSLIIGTISYKFYRGTTLGVYPASQTSATRRHDHVGNCVNYGL